MNISNRTLGLLLIAAIIVSIGSTFIVLDTVVVTGYVTNNVTATNIAVQDYISITVSKDNIDFGICSLNKSLGLTTTFDSSLSASSANNSLCNMDWELEDYFLLENEGVVPVKINISSDAFANDLYLDSNSSSTINSQYYVKINNGSACFQDAQLSYLPLNNSDITLCNFFNYENSNNTLKVYARVEIDNFAVAQSQQTTWSFTAWN